MLAWAGQCAAGSQRGRLAYWTSEQMGVSSLPRAGLPGEHGSERACAFGSCWGVGVRKIWARGKPVEGCGDRGEVVEGEEAVGAGAEFSGCLCATKKEKTKESGLVTAQVKDGACAMFILGDATVASWSDEAEILEGVKGLADVFFRELKDGIPGRFLVAGRLERVQRERIVLGGGDLFFDESAEYTKLGGREVHGYKGATKEEVQGL